MFSLPEWAPNVHPLVVHFPIALLFVAAAVDLMALILRRHTWLRWVASGLFTLGAATAVVVFYTGRDAADSVFLPTPAANAVLADHENWAMWTVWFYGVYALARLVVEWRGVGEKRLAHIPLFVVGALGLALVKETGEYGAQLVFQYGVGTAVEMQQPHHAEVSEAHVPPDEGEAERDHGHAEGNAPNIMENGGWRWDIDRESARVLQTHFTWLEGEWADVHPEAIRDADAGTVLLLRPHGRTALFVLDSPIRSVQFDLRLNLDGFEGIVRLAHHVQDARNYHFMEIEGTEISLGRLVDGRVDISDRGRFDAKGWIGVRAVGDGTHFRGYIQQEMVAHGHGRAPAPGSVGLFVQGTGILKMDGLVAHALR